MNPDLKPGTSDEQTITTTPEMGIVHLGPDAPSMFSTPAMIQLIEGTCVRLISRYVESGEQSDSRLSTAGSSDDGGGHGSDGQPQSIVSTSPTSSAVVSPSLSNGTVFIKIGRKLRLAYTDP